MGYDDDDYDDGYDDDHYDSPNQSSGGVGCLVMAVIVGVLFLVLAGAGLVFFRFLGAAGSARSYGNEAAAIGALKTIGAAQSLHREGDKDNDGVLDYAASLSELGQGRLIDQILASGAKQGYVFECHNGPDVQFEWFATADPAQPGRTGSRFFYVDHAGVIFYSTTGPIQGPVDASKLPPGVLPVGR